MLIVLLAARPVQALDPSVLTIEFGAVPFLLFAALNEPPSRPPPTRLRIGTGAFDAVDDENVASEVFVEYHPQASWWKGAPFVGAALTTDGGVQAYGGLRVDARVWHQLRVSPSFALTLYGAGKGKDLGSLLVARSGLDMTWKLRSGDLVGLGFHHMSHGGIFGSNPGTETLSLSYAFAFE